MTSHTQRHDESQGFTFLPFHTCCYFKMWCKTDSYSCAFFQTSSPRAQNVSSSEVLCSVCRSICSQTPSFQHHPLLPPSPALHPNNRSNCILLSAGTNIDLFSGPTSARIRALLPPPPLPSLNGDYVQQSSLLSNQRISQKSHSLVMTLLFSEHVEFGWLYHLLMVFLWVFIVSHELVRTLFTLLWIFESCWL